MLRQRTLLMLTIAGIVPAFLIINVLVGMARARQQGLADEWAARGARDLAGGAPGAAAEDFRAAQAFARDRSQYRLQLAQALLAAGRSLEARSELETLWSEAPGSGLVNEQLARLAAGQGADADAIRYYHAAIDGAWYGNGGVARRSARLELARLFFSRGRVPQAQAEIAVLISDPPVDPRAWRLAGEVAFALGDYRGAVQGLTEAARANELDEPTRELLVRASRVVALDPYARALGARQRLRRVLRAYAARCASASTNSAHWISCPARSSGSRPRSPGRKSSSPTRRGANARRSPKAPSAWPRRRSS